MTNFDPFEIPLKGTSIIEANAGCGKTEALTDLYLRLILEEALTPRNILVVTYTVAATAELKERIQRKLRKAAGHLEEALSDSPELAAFLFRSVQKIGREEALERIHFALRAFDEAAIFTIHGFCHRILRDFAYETGGFFDYQVIDGVQAELNEILEDHLRCHLYHAWPEVVAFAQSAGYHLKHVKKVIEPLLLNPTVRIIPQVTAWPPKKLEEALFSFREALGLLSVAWPEKRERIRNLLQGPALKANIYGVRTDKILRTIEELIAPVQPNFPLPGDLRKLTTGNLSQATKKGHSPPDDDIFRLVDELYARAQSLEEILTAYFRYLTINLAVRLPEELARKNQNRQVLSFDDLLWNLYRTLQGKTAESLLQVIRNKYRAALIDEFQDTDPISHSIFQRIFEDGGLATFYIGDPKQAIYSFRGADVFSYLSATRNLAAKYTLARNWRSDGRLIQAVNRVFSGREAPFVIKEISFFPSEPAQGEADSPLILKGLSEAPLQLWYLARDCDPGQEETTTEEGNGNPSPKLTIPQAVNQISLAVAGEIKRLLNLSQKGEATIGGRPLHERDIAILVRTNRQARIIKSALSKMNVRSAIHGVGNVFDSDEAEELERLLWALASPGDERLIRAALATPFFRFTSSMLDRILKEEELKASLSERFRHYRDLWQERGFVIMFRFFLTQEDIRANLLKYENGERYLTNVLHLTELLHQAERTTPYGLSGLCRFLTEKRREKTDESKTRQLRLESDEETVRIVTIHKSKGLDYPIVFCPFSWGAVRMDKQAIFFHNEEEHWRLTCDLGSGNQEENRRKSWREALAEDCRLLYVALTRAKHRCYFVWGPAGRAESSAADYLLHGRGQAPGSINKSPSQKGAGNELLRNLKEMSGRFGKSINLSLLPGPGVGEVKGPDRGEPPILNCRHFTGIIDSSWRVASVSQLISDAASIRIAEGPDYDESLPAFNENLTQDMIDEKILTQGSHKRARPIAPSDPAGIAGMPKGARVGILLHEILQGVDFPEIETDPTRNLVERKLATHGFSTSWTKDVWELLGKVVHVPLDDMGLKLADIKRDSRIDEMSFYFPLRRIDKGVMHELFSPYVNESAYLKALTDRLYFSPVRGFMRGFIDLVFCAGERYYLVDWKSNFLGDLLSDYTPANINRQMTDSLYVFQYLVYTTALHQYLKVRLPGYCYTRHFGGVYYLFLRGMDPRHGRNYGVYYDRPPEELIESLRTGLIDMDRGQTK